MILIFLVKINSINYSFNVATCAYYDKHSHKNLCRSSKSELPLLGTEEIPRGTDHEGSQDNEEQLTPGEPVVKHKTKS